MALHTSIQDILFHTAKEKLPSGQSLADTVADVLFISTDSAYRRMRGETPLILEEAKALCLHFDISLDQLLEIRPGSVSFRQVHLDNSLYPFKNFLSGILQHLKAVAASGGELIYLAKDLPLFHHFNLQPLFTFRYFFWMKSILHHPDFKNAKFSFDILPSDIGNIGAEILQVYNSIPSTEIWSAECANSLIRQVEYYREAGYFESQSDINAIYEAVKKTLLHIRVQTEKGKKSVLGASETSNDFTLYYNRVVLGDNTILALQPTGKTVYLNYDVLNYMITDDQKFCDDVEEKLRNLIKRATIISSVSEKQRNIFFNVLLNKIP